MAKKFSATTVNFSVSNNNADILDILKDQQNKSEFICQAIREKYSNDRGEFSDKMTVGQREFLHNEIKTVPKRTTVGSNSKYSATPAQTPASFTSVVDLYNFFINISLNKKER